MLLLLIIGDREDSAHLLFYGKAGDSVVVSMANFGTHFKSLINEVEAFEANSLALNFLVARVLCKVKPNFQNGVKSWIENGVGHNIVIY